MQCPYCNEEMFAGEINSQNFERNLLFPVFYIDEDNKIPLYTSISPVSYIAGQRLCGHYCPHCRKIILDVPEPKKKKR